MKETSKEIREQGEASHPERERERERERGVMLESLYAKNNPT